MFADGRSFVRAISSGLFHF